MQYGWRWELNLFVGGEWGGRRTGGFVGMAEGSSWSLSEAFQAAASFLKPGGKIYTEHQLNAKLCSFAYFISLEKSLGQECVSNLMLRDTL